MILLRTKLSAITFRPRTPYLCLALVSLFFLVTTGLWVSLDRSPGAWDDAWYLTNSLTLYDTLVDRGFIAYWKKFLGTLQFKAPLIAVLPTPLYRLFGRSSHVAYGVNLAFMVVLFGSVFRFARRYGSTRSGLVAVCVTATMPLLYGLSRQYLVEYGLTAGLFSGARGEIDRFFDEVEAGVCYVNKRSGATTGAWPGAQPFCGWKGSAEYFDVEVDGKTAKGGAWHYPEPFELCDYLKDHFAFWRGVEIRL